MTQSKVKKNHKNQTKWRGAISWFLFALLIEKVIRFANSSGYDTLDDIEKNILSICDGLMSWKKKEIEKGKKT